MSEYAERSSDVGEPPDEDLGLPPDPEYPVPTEIYAAVLAARGELMVGLIVRVKNGDEMSIEEQVGTLHLLQEAINLRHETRKKIAELEGSLSACRQAMVEYSNAIACTAVDLRTASTK